MLMRRLPLNSTGSCTGGHQLQTCMLPAETESGTSLPIMPLLCCIWAGPLCMMAASIHGRGDGECRAEGMARAWGMMASWPAQRVEAYLGDVQAVQQHPPGGDIDQAEQRQHQRRLPAARAPHHAAAGARLSRQPCELCLVSPTLC